MEEFLQELESTLGVPAALIERAAVARAGASGGSAEGIVRAWAGAGEAPPAAAPPAEAPPPATAPTEAPPPSPAAAAAAPEPATQPESASPLEVEVLDAEEPPPEGDELDEGERVGVLAGFPSWLAGALLAVPILALAYVLIAPNGPGCGSSGQLAIDAETGLAENCDGTEYGLDVLSFFGIGEGIYADRCLACHAADGGGSTGPGLSGGAVLVTFPAEQCAEHVRWIDIGTDAWPEATYGANATPVGGSGAAMPGFGGSLTPEELAAVAIYERVAFGGQPLPEAEADCGADELELAAGG